MLLYDGLANSDSWYILIHSRSKLSTISKWLTSEERFGLTVGNICPGENFDGVLCPSDALNMSSAARMALLLEAIWLEFRTAAAVVGDAWKFEGYARFVGSA